MSQDNVLLQAGLRCRATAQEPTRREVKVFVALFAYLGTRVVARVRFGKPEARDT